ncbi:peptidase domain-containing ABC transporter [Chitinophaga flava]|uniref:ABC transporter ATP-binding protein n=1 Tax=Chitinophaga flava TaxID=2259036 RepID=A0A365XTI8_9BACT|nr:peptidase domain-containing ABC transporter [Chitinophaga flava]RBL89460.1 ABC transporter ATP-binding protein [Chitinophaga flava]
MSFPFYFQYDAMDCGPTCIRMIARFYGKDIGINRIRNLSNINKEGVSLLGISDAAEKIGFKTRGAKITFDQLDSDASLPCILHWKENHFIVLPPQNYNKNKKGQKILIADPGHGLIKIDKETFLRNWLGASDSGVVLLLETTPAFFQQENDPGTKASWSTLFFYLKDHRRYFFQIFLGLLLGSLLQMVFPFLTQGIVDNGINTGNLHFIYIVLIAQLVLFFSRTVVDFVRTRLLLFISTRINISLLTGFWQKLMRLPLSYYDTKKTGDILQRIQDQNRIEQFLTGGSLNIFFSVINIFIFCIILFIYNSSIFLVYTAGSILYFLWVKLFLKYRRDLNYRRFAVASRENMATLQLIHGMQEIKLNNAEKQFRWKWETVQGQLFNLGFRSLTLSQYQQAGAFFLNEGKNILITFLVAKAVLDGHLTLGAMLAIQYIIGQLNAPVEQLIGVAQSFQDAKIALERLQETHMVEDEEPDHTDFITDLPADKSINIRNLYFKYPGSDNEPVFNGINLSIPANKMTAIVGMSGSGKTTLLKILLKFYDNYQGEIKVGESNFKYISPSYWRSQCGSVMQEGYIFNDTIARNIAVRDENPDRKKLLKACEVANILQFIESQAKGFNTNIGAEGNGISQGQHQRLLIARAVYKNPEYILLDEATNSLDANNEKVILENLSTFLQGKTALVVAHRLSTVKQADKIVVMDKGQIVEEGTHKELIMKKSYYYELVKNQLELGN